LRTPAGIRTVLDEAAVKRLDLEAERARKFVLRHIKDYHGYPELGKTRPPVPQLSPAIKYAVEAVAEFNTSAIPPMRSVIGVGRIFFRLITNPTKLSAQRALSPETTSNDSLPRVRIGRNPNASGSDRHRQCWETNPELEGALRHSDEDYETGPHFLRRDPEMARN
jgi:hypothetical protein